GAEVGFLRGHDLNIAATRNLAQPESHSLAITLGERNVFSVGGDDGVFGFAAAGELGEAQVLEICAVFILRPAAKNVAGESCDHDQREEGYHRTTPRPPSNRISWTRFSYAAGSRSKAILSALPLRVVPVLGESWSFGDGATRARNLAGDRRDEAVTPTRNGFNKGRIVGRIAESVTKLLDGSVETLIELDVGSIRPQAAAQVFAADHFARMLQQCGENLKGLVLEADRKASS